MIATDGLLCMPVLTTARPTRLFASTPRAAQAALDMELRTPLLGAFCAKAERALARDSASAVASAAVALAPIVAALCACDAPATAPSGRAHSAPTAPTTRAVMSAGAPSLQIASGEKSTGPEWAEGVHVLMVLAKRSMIGTLQTDAPAAPGTLALASACLAALARLLEPYTTGGSRNLTNLTNPSTWAPESAAPTTAPEWSVAVLYELLIDRIRPAARLEPPPPSLPAVVAAMAPLWAAMASLPFDASQQPLITLAIPWLLPPPTPPSLPPLMPLAPPPPAGSASLAVVACRLLPLLLSTLVHSHASIPLDQSFAQHLLALCLAGHPPADGAVLGTPADGAPNVPAEDLERTKLESESEMRLRALCVFFNKWASAEALEMALATSLVAAKAGDVPALRAWLWLGRAAVCRGGRYASTVPQALVGLLTAPSASLAPAALHSWLQRAAEGVSVLMAAPAPDLRKASGARTAPLLSQRLYVALAPALRTALDQTKPPEEHAPTTALTAAERPTRLDASSWALLDALTLCLVHAPPATLFAEPTSAVPYLVAWLREAGTELGEDVTPSTAAAGLPTAVPTATRWQRLPRVLQLACQLLVQLPPSAAEPLSQLLPALTALLRVGEPLSLGAQVDTLEAALECLSAACVLPPHCLVPHKKRVLRALMPALDHHKRRVRHAARLCASQWHLTVLSTVGTR